MLLKLFSKKEWETLKKMQVIMMCGMVGSGKSFIAKKIASKVNAVYLSTDEIRWCEVIPYDLGFSYNNFFKIERFDEKGFKKVYKKLWDKINKYISYGKKVVIDASFLNRRRKIWAARLSRKVNNNLCLIHVKTDINIILQRIKKRAQEREKKELYEPGIKAIKYYQEKIKKGEVNWPKMSDAPFVYQINNNHNL